MDDDAASRGEGFGCADTSLVALELHEALAAIGAPAILMSIVASWMLTQDESTTLELLRQFNASRIKTGRNLH